MKILYHEATDENGGHLGLEFCDGNGKLWTVPFGEPTEFENAFMADKILEHNKYMGVVEVKFNKTKTGLQYDIEDAIKRCHVALLHSEKACVNDYIKTQLESRVQRNYPPLPPVGRALMCIIKHKVNLLAYGLRPVGWEPPYEMDGGMVDPQLRGDTGVGMGMGGPTPATVNVEERIRQLETQLVTQSQLISQLVKGGAAIPRGRVTKVAADLLNGDAAPAPRPPINIHEGADDTPESINL